MNAKKLVAALLIAVVAIGAIWLVLPKNDDPDTSSSTETSTGTVDQTPSDSATEEDTAETASSFTATEVMQHNTADDCWTIIGGNVYDLTSFISQHPGGDEILRACGQDGSSLFNQRETETGEEVGSGTPHSSSARSQLERLKIGSLAD